MRRGHGVRQAWRQKRRQKAAEAAQTTQVQTARRGTAGRRRHGAADGKQHRRRQCSRRRRRYGDPRQRAIPGRRRATADERRGATVLPELHEPQAGRIRANLGELNSVSFAANLNQMTVRPRWSSRYRAISDDNLSEAQQSWALRGLNMQNRCVMRISERTFVSHTAVYFGTAVRLYGWRKRD